MELLSIKGSANVQEKLEGEAGLPVLLLKLSEQLHIVRAELSGRGWWQGGRRKRCGGRGGSGLQGCGCRHLASHLTDRVGHRVLHPWESRTQPTSNLVCRHLWRRRRSQWKHHSAVNDAMLGWTVGKHLASLAGSTDTLYIEMHLFGWTRIQIWNAKPIFSHFLFILLHWHRSACVESTQ